MNIRIITTVLCVTVATNLLSAEAAAQSNRDFQVGLGGQFAFTAHEFCQRDLDLVECTNGKVAMGGQIYGLYHFKKRLAIGANISGWFDLNRSAQVTTDVSGASVNAENGLLIWRTTAEIRAYPIKARVLQLWTAAEIGVTGGLDFHRNVVTGEGDERLHQIGFATGLGVGLDFVIIQRLLLGIQARALLLAYGKAPATPENQTLHATDLGTAVWPVIGFVNISYLF